MGQAIGIPFIYHVFLTDYPEIANDSYTVERTSGEVDSGWRIPASSPVDNSVTAPAASIHASITAEMKGGWRIFMDNDAKDINLLRGGWRRVETIWPTRLHGDVEAIDKWRNETLIILEELEKKRLASQASAAIMEACVQDQ